MKQTTIYFPEIDSARKRSRRYVGEFVETVEYGPVFWHYQRRNVRMRSGAPMTLPVAIIEEMDRRGIQHIVIGYPGRVGTNWLYLNRSQLTDLTPYSRGEELQYHAHESRWREIDMPTTVKDEKDELTLNPYDTRAEARMAA